MTTDAREAVIDAIRDLVHLTERQRVGVAGDAGISATDLTALSHLRIQPLSQRELAGWVGITSSSVTVLVDRLERSGLAVRTGDPADRRKSIVAITDEGQLCDQQLRDHFHAALDRLPARELPSIATALSHLLRATVAADTAGSAAGADASI